MNKITFFSIVFSVGLSICSCNKTATSQITNAQLVGTWVEQSPCVQGVGSCYEMTFTSNYHCYFSSPYIDSPTYTLPDGDSIAFLNDLYEGHYKVNISNEQILTIEKFYDPPSITLTSKPVDVKFKKQ